MSQERSIHSKDQSKGVGCQPAAPENLNGASLKLGVAWGKGAKE